MRERSEPATDYKQQAAVRAVDLVKPGMVVGLGTGSTAVFAIRRIGARQRIRSLSSASTSFRLASLVARFRIAGGPECGPLDSVRSP